MLGENTALSEKAEAGPGRVPKVLCDRFVLETRLEHGRLGVVYRALDRLRAQDGRSHVAVLILPADIARSPEQLAAFEKELEAVRMLSHPNIVRMFGLERDGETTFVVLEWVDGESLRSVMDSLAPETVCEADAFGVVRAVGNALVYAHARGIVHGDVRPENVLVTERGEVRVLFTPACLARTSPFSVSTRDDVRGLAALAYELMSGTPPPIAGLYPRSKADEPEPIEGLSRKRWKALRSALSVRDGRIPSVRKLLAALDLPEPRAPRLGGRPDRVRDARGGFFKRTAVASAVGIGIAALGAVALHLWNERADDLPNFSATVESGAGRAAELTREGLTGAKAQLGRAGNALASLWSDLGERAGRDEAAEDAEAEAGAAGTADDEVLDTELFEAEELNGSSAEAPNRPSAENSSAAPEPEGADGGGVAARAVERAADEPSGGADSVSADRRGAESGQGADADSAGERSAEIDRATVQAASDASDTTREAESDLEPEAPPAREAEPVAREASADAEAEQQAERVAEPQPATAAPSQATPAAAVAANTAVSPSSARLAFSRREYVVSESEGVAAIEVVREDARGDVSFVWWTRDGSAQSGDDYADLGRRVEQLRNGETVRVLYVPITSDSIVEERREYFEILLGVLSDDGNQSSALESAQVTIVDDDR